MRYQKMWMGVMSVLCTLPPGGTYGPSYGRRAYNPPQSYDRSYMGGAYGQGPMGQYQKMQEPRQGEGYWENRAALSAAIPRSRLL